MEIVKSPEMMADHVNKFFTTALAYFKWAKVPANPFSYGRNVQSNLFQWTMSGANPVTFFTEYTVAIDSLARKDKWYDMARELGLLDDNPNVT